MLKEQQRRCVGKELINTFLIFWEHLAGLLKAETTVWIRTEHQVNLHSQARPEGPVRSGTLHSRGHKVPKNTGQAFQSSLR